MQGMRQISHALAGLVSFRQTRSHSGNPRLGRTFPGADVISRSAEKTQRLPGLSPESRKQYETESERKICMISISRWTAGEPAP